MIRMKINACHAIGLAKLAQVQIISIALIVIKIKVLILNLIITLIIIQVDAYVLRENTMTKKIMNATTVIQDAKLAMDLNFMIV